MNKPYPKYKPSGVEWLGDVPEHWEVKALKYLFENLDYRRIPIAAEDRSGIDKIYPYYGASGIIDYVEDYIYDETLILVAEDGANLLSRSTPLAFRAEGKYWVNNHAHILRPKFNVITYWESVLQLFDYTPYVSGSAQPKLTADNLGSFQLPVPPLPEQLAIAAFLDRETGRIDALIAKKQRLLELLAEQRTALISRAVTKGLDASVKLKPSGVEWLGDVPEHWGVKKIVFLLDRLQDGTHFSPESDFSGEFLYITAKNIKEWGFDFSEITFVTKEAHDEIYRRCPVKKGDVLYIKDGATAGIATVNTLDEEFSMLSSVAMLRPRITVMDSGFLKYHLNTEGFKSFVLNSLVGGAMTRFTIEIISKFRLIAPPLPEQQAIAAFLDRETAKIDTLSAKVTTVIERLKEYRTALISSAVTGKIDVREAV